MDSNYEDEKIEFGFIFSQARDNVKWSALLFIAVWFVAYATGVLCVQGVITFWDLPDLSVILKGIIVGEYLEYVTTLKIIQIILHLFQYLIPALTFAFLVYKKDALKELYADTFPNFQNLFLGIGLVVAIYPLVSFIYYWNTQLLPSNFIAQNKLGLQRVFLEMNSSFDFVLNLFLFGLVAGLGEELFFRGILQKIIIRWLKNIHFGAIFTGMLFSLMHFQWEGFLPRLMLGVLFCYVLIFSLNVWLSVFLHIFFNSMQVVIPFFYPSLVESINHVEPVSPLAALFSSFVFAVLLVIFVKVNQNKKYK